MNESQKTTIASKKDFDVSYYKGSGAGGQAKNKTSSGVQIIHRESGAIGRSSETRSQHDNKELAFNKLVKTPQFRFWLAKKKYELDQGEKIEETVANETTDKDLKYEIKNALGHWEEVNAEYFNGVAAKEEVN